jgi:hypothetical protein
MTERRTSTLMARLDHGNALEIALQRRESIRLLLGQAKAQGFDVRRLRADLRAIEGEVRQLQAHQPRENGSDTARVNDESL